MIVLGIVMIILVVIQLGILGRVMWLTNKQEDTVKETVKLQRVSIGIMISIFGLYAGMLWIR